MKKYINILFAAAVSALALVSCVKEQEVKPGTPDAEDCQGVYFPKQDVIEETQIFDPTQEKVAIIKVARGVSEGALTIVPKVSLSEITSAGTVDGDVALFTVSDIVFEDGQTETEMEIEFPEVKEGVQYSLHLAVEGDQYTSKYSSKVNTCDFKVMCVAYQDFLNPVTKERAKITFTQGIWAETHTAYLKYYEVDGVRYCQTYDEELVGEGGKDGGFWGQDKDVHFEFMWYVGGTEECDCDDKSHSTVIPTDAVAGIPSGAQMIRVLPVGIVNFGGSYLFYPYDYYSYYKDKNGYARCFSHFIVKNELFGNVSYYDKNGGFFFWIYGYTAASSGWVGAWGEDGVYDVIGIAEGFTRADYTLKLDAGITEYNAKAEANVVPVSFQVGPDVDKVGYTILEGIASGAAIDAEIAAIAKDTIDFKYATYVEAKGESFIDKIALEESGIYTLVAVAQDTLKKVQSSASINFKYLATDDQDKVIVSVSAGGTEKYASRGYSSTSSIEYTITGAGITGAFPFVVPEAKVEAAGGADEYAAQLMEDSGDYYSLLGNEDYARYYLSATALADVNDNGFSSIASGLNANTMYYVFVWATNGYGSTVSYASYKTDGLPNEIIKNGTATYTYSLFFTDADENPVDDSGLNLEYNPNTKLYEIPNWGYGVTLAFSVDEEGNISVPLQPTGYTHSSYGDVQITDFSHLDEYCGSGFCEYFGIDPTQKGYIDEDGTYHFLVAYAVTAGTFGSGEEYFYPDGKPVATGVVGIPVKNAMSFNGKLQSMKGVTPVKENNFFVKVAEIKNLEPVTSVLRVAAKHTVSSFKSVRSAKNSDAFVQFDMHKKMN